MIIDEHEDLDKIEHHLCEIMKMSEELNTADTIGVEAAAQRIHVCFGGTDKDAIYPEGYDD